MSEFEVSAVTRSETGKGAVRRLRSRGLVPGIIYGAGRDPQNICMKDNELRKSLESEAFFSHILTVNVDGSPTQAVLKDMQRNPGTYEVTHVDFLRVKATEALTMRVPLHFINESTSPGLRAGGVANHLISDLEISCLPRNLPEFIEVDLGPLDIGDSVHLSGLVLPEGVSLANAIEDADHDHTVVAIQQAHDLTVEPEEEEEGEAEGEGEAESEED